MVERDANRRAGEAQSSPGSFRALAHRVERALPRAGVVRLFDVIEHPIPTATNPLGAKGVGEAAQPGRRLRS